MARNLLREEVERRVLRAAVDLAMTTGIDMDGTVDLARHLAREALERSSERARVLEELRDSAAAAAD